MENNAIFSCIDAYTAAFAEVEKGEGCIRFRDDALPDMYDHNFTVIQAGTPLEACGEMIQKELAERKAEGKAFYQVNMRLPRYEQAERAFFQAAFPLKPDVTQYVNCVSDAPKSLHLAGREDCIVRRVNAPAIAQHRTQIELAAYSESYGADFCRRKGERNALVYIPEGGVDSYVGYVGEKPVGKADLLVHEGVAMIEDFDVHPSVQRQGFGTAILRELVKQALHQGAKTVFMVTDADDTAKDMYTKLGFKQIPGRLSAFFGLAGA